MNPYFSLLHGLLQFKTRGLRLALATKVPRIRRFADDYARYPDERLRGFCDELRALARDGLSAEQLEIQLFALIAEQARRRLNMDPFEVQLQAALVLSRGKIIQMGTGEGKTLVAPFAAILDVLYGRRVTIVTPNDYLSRRDYEWMAPLYQAFGIPVVTVQPGMSLARRRQAYLAPVVYVSTRQLVFDYLRKHHALNPEGNLPLSLDSVIIDEIDNVLIDQGSRPFALTNRVYFEAQVLKDLARYERDLVIERDFSLLPKVGTLEFTDDGHEKLSQIAAQEDLPFGECRFYLRCLLLAAHHFQRDRHYLREPRRIVPIDQISGRPNIGGTFSFGIQQAIELHERLPLSHPQTVINQISLHSFFTQYGRISGMSGSAIHNALEFKLLYRLDVVPIPPNRPLIRRDEPDIVFVRKRSAIESVVGETMATRQNRRPVLIGTVDVDDAQKVSGALGDAGIAHALLTARNHFQEAGIIAQAGRAGQVTVAARMAGRGVDIKLDDVARAAGGLHVIGLSRQEDRRLDVQLQGRAGRQGEPGSTRFTLSLEDDFLQAFGSPWTRRMVARSDITDESPIESRVLHRTVARAQRRLTLQQFAQRRHLLVMSGFLEQSRRFVFARRTLLSWQQDHSQAVDDLLQRFGRDLQVLASSELEERLLETQERFRILLSPQLWTLARDDVDVLAERLVIQLRQAYQERRRTAADFAHARERMILLRSIDYSWSIFLERIQTVFHELGFHISQMSPLHGLSEAHKRWRMAHEALGTEINHLSLYYLMHIDDPPVLQEIKFWRGLGVLVGRGTNQGQLDDGIEVPEDSLIIYAREPKGKDQPGPSPAPLLLADGSLEAPAPANLGQAVRDYLAYVDSGQDWSEKQRDRARHSLQEFTSFAGGEGADPLTAQTTVDAYLKRLASLGVGYFGRRRQRRILQAFLSYLQSRRGPGSYAARNEPTGLRGRLRRFAVTATNPLLLMQLAAAILVFALCYLLARWPVPFLEFDPNPYYALPVPASWIQIADGLFSFGALSTIGVGALGIWPLLFTRSLSRAWRQQPNVGSPFLYVPASLAGALILTLFLLGTARNGESLAAWQASLVWLSLAGAAMAIVLLLWVLDAIEFVGFIGLTLLGNGLVIVAQEAWPVLGRITTADVVQLGAGLAGVIGLLFLRRHLGQVSLDVVRSGRFDFQAGRIRNSAARLTFQTIFDGYHYVTALFLVAILGYWGDRLMMRLSFARPWRDPAWLLVGAYLLVMAWLILQKARFRLSPRSLSEYFKGTASFPAGFRDWREAVNHVRGVVRRRVWLSTVLEMALVVLLLTLVSALLRPVRAGLAGLFYAALVAQSLYLIQVTWRQIAATFARSGSATVFLPPPEPDVAESEPWYRRTYHAVRQEHGLIGFLIGLAGLVSFFDYLYRFARWLWLTYGA